jgi:hypothetical protein
MKREPRRLVPYRYLTSSAPPGVLGEQCLEAH